MLCCRQTVSPNAAENLALIAEHSPLPNEQALLLMLGRIEALGTCIVIYNLRTQDDGQLELDFDTDNTDIRLREIAQQPGASVYGGGRATKFTRSRNNQPSDQDVPIDYSLKEYCRILYLEPRMQIVLRFKKVRTKRILKTTDRRKTVAYRPQAMASAAPSRAKRPEGYTVQFGFQPEQEEHLYGVMLYHHNRLIVPYHRVGVQLQPNRDGVGVLGVIEADFLDPTHNKQDFDDNQAWRRLLASLSEKLNMYWYEEQTRKAQEQAAMPRDRRAERLPPRRVPQATIEKMLALLEQLWQPLNSSEFRELPSRAHFADYYRMIKKPIALSQIKAKIKTGQYRTMLAMQKDVQLMCDNAKQYNAAGSALHSHALLLEGIVANHVGGGSANTAISVEDEPGADAEDGADEGAAAGGGVLRDNWVQCDDPACLKWRKLPFGSALGDDAADWFCHMNPDERYNSCEIGEEKEEEATSRQNTQFKVNPAVAAERQRRKQAEQEAAAAREAENLALRQRLQQAEAQAAQAQAAQVGQEGQAEPAMQAAQPAAAAAAAAGMPAASQVDASTLGGLVGDHAAAARAPDAAAAVAAVHHDAAPALAPFGNFKEAHRARLFAADPTLTEVGFRVQCEALWKELSSDERARYAAPQPGDGRQRRGPLNGGVVPADDGLAQVKTEPGLGGVSPQPQYGAGAGGLPQQSPAAVAVRFGSSADGYAEPAAGAAAAASAPLGGAAPHQPAQAPPVAAAGGDGAAGVAAAPPGNPQPAAPAQQPPLAMEDELQHSADIELVCETLTDLAGRVVSRSVLQQLQSFIQTLT